MNTLFYSPEIVVNQLNSRFEIDITLKFAQCADEQLTAYFIKITGIKPSKQVSIAIPPSVVPLNYKSANISKIDLQVYVNNNWNRVTMCWQSNSGKIYKTSDTEIDCEDVQFWLEGLDVPLYYKQLSPNANFPFKLKNLTFDLTFTNMVTNAVWEFRIKEERLLIKNDIIRELGNFINNFNDNSEKKNRVNGLVHNFEITEDNEWLISTVDIGSAGAYFYKMLLKFLSKLNCFTEVIIK